MSKRNRLFAILLALAMVVTYMPALAYAETTPDGDQTQVEDGVGDETDGQTDGEEEGDGQDPEGPYWELTQGDDTVELVDGAAELSVSVVYNGYADETEYPEIEYRWFKESDTGNDTELEEYGESITVDEVGSYYCAASETGSDDGADVQTMYFTVIPYEEDPGEETDFSINSENEDSDLTKYVNVNNSTATTFELAYTIQCPSEMVDEILTNYDVVKRHGHENVFTISEKNLSYDEDLGTIKLAISVESEEGLSEGDYYCDLHLKDNRVEDEEAERFLAQINLGVLNHDHDDYIISVNYNSFEVPDLNADQTALDEEFADQKDVTITNTGNGPVNVSGDSYVINEENSDIEAFIIERVDETKQLEPGDSWTGLTVFPKAGVGEGNYHLSIEISDETGYATTSAYITYKAGNPLVIQSNPEEVYFEFDPAQEESVGAPIEVCLDNYSNSEISKVTAESSNDLFTAEIKEAAEDGSVTWSSYESLTLVVDVTNKQPTEAAEGEITVTAETEDGRSKPLIIPVHLYVEKKEEPHFSVEEGESYSEISTDELLVDEEGDTHTIFWPYFSTGGYDYDSDLRSYFAFNLSGKDAGLFEIQDELSEGYTNVYIKPKKQTSWEARTYKFTLNLYHDPEGNVTTEGTPIDSLDFTLDVYDSNDYKIAVVDEKGNPVMDEDGDYLDPYVVDFGALEVGYTESAAENLRKTIKLKNVGNKAITIDPQFFIAEDAEERGVPPYNCSYIFNDGDNGVKTLQPNDTYEFTVAPAANMEQGGQWSRYTLRDVDLKASISISTNYVVVEPGFHLSVDGRDDGDGNFVVDLGVDSKNKEKATDPFDIIRIENCGTVAAHLTKSDVTANDGIICGFTADTGDLTWSEYHDKLFNAFRIYPGDYVYAVVMADYNTLRASDGVYNTEYTVDAAAIGADDEPTGESASYTIKAKYEISDDTCDVTFDFRGIDEFENKTVTIAKGADIYSALDQLYEDLGVEYYGDFSADGYRCIGYSYNEDGNYKSWGEYYSMREAMEEEISSIREGKTVYFDWAQAADPVEITTEDLKCGETLEEVTSSVKVEGLGEHCKLDSITCEDSDYSTLKEDDVIDASKHDEYNILVNIIPDFGWVVDSYIINGEEKQCSQVGEATLYSSVSAKHTITQVPGTSATCESAGTRTHYECRGCKTWFSDQSGETPALPENFVIPAKGHSWGAPEYQWTDDNTSCTAKVVCSRDSSHELTETVTAEVSSDTDKCDVERTATYTAVFEDPDDPDYLFETQTKEVTLPAGEHTWKIESTEPATCTEVGSNHFKCTVCGETKTETIPATGVHTWGEWKETKAATCTEAGTKERECSICREKETEAIPATGEHSWNDGEVTTPATCVAEGVKTFKCTVCGKTKTEAIPATGEHTWGEWKETKAATCAETGTKERECSVCHEKENETIAATGEHSWDAGEVTTPATCSAEGVKTFKCTVCSKTKTEAIPATGEHTWGEWKETKAATCAETGTKERECSVCHEKENETIAATGEHSWDAGEVTTPATCVAEGVKTFKCTVCGETKTEVIPAEHNWDAGEVTTPATCSADGVKTFTCNDCHVSKTEVIPATGKHTMGEKVVENEVPATCSAQGHYDEVVYCTVCKTELSRATIKTDIDKFNHTPGERVVENEVPATCGKDGGYDEVVYCTGCNTELSRASIKIPATGEHTAGKAVHENEVAATCIKDGSYDVVVRCTGCGEELTREAVTVPATGVHTPGEAKHENEVAATCTKEGSYEAVICCTGCGEELSRETVTVPATSHIWNKAYTVDKSATYAAAGSKSIHCSVCNAVKPNSAVSVPKLTVKAVTLSKVTPAKKSFTAKWKKGTGITGYELQYALNKKFTKSKKTVRITKASTASKKVKKLKAKKKYYVRIRAYKTVSGKKYYSAWSKVKSVKTK